MKLGVLCSGGKDSLFACGRAMEKEEVVCLIAIRPENEESYMFHTPNVSLVPLQAEAAGLPLIEIQSAGEKETELGDLRQGLILAREQQGIEGVVTGAVLSVYQATRIQQICHDLGLWCFNPLWYIDQEKYLNSLLEKGFKVLVSGVFAEPFDERWLGRPLDYSAVTLLKHYREHYGIMLTGEGGEYETFVLDAPFFTKRIEIIEASTDYQNYRGFYRIIRARLVDK
ncbi:MAG: diphthine--ammonia ligase [Methanoregulaceae archaeon]|jgi:ABC transporter with metal-binding/Fe-S-binding domain ATP-binding protein|nr:diphthine--ammonia ligase [Methanoregulaceae archaeon]